jgi:hypothetical protein
MTVEDARREVLSWALPLNEASVDRSFYVTVADVASYPWPTEGSMLYWSVLGRLRDEVKGAIRPRQNEPAFRQPDDVLIVVEGSQRGIDLYHSWGDGVCCCGAAAAGERYPFLAIFDATRGGEVGTAVVYPPDLADSLAAKPPSTILQRGSPSATSIPTSSPTSSPSTPSPATPLPSDATAAAPLRSGQVPAPLVRAVREMAEVPGSRWVYRVTALEYDLHWSYRVVIETIASSVPVAPDILMSRRRVCSSGATSSGLDQLGTVTCEDGRPYFVFAKGRVETNEDHRGTVTLAEMRTLLNEPPKQVDGWGGIMETMRLPLRPNEEYRGDLYGGGPIRWSTGEKASIEVPRGRFDGCIALNRAVEMYNPHVDWTCPGVGVVRKEDGNCAYSSPSFSLGLSELIEYDIPPVVPVR